MQNGNEQQFRRIEQTRTSLNYINFDIKIMGIVPLTPEFDKNGQSFDWLGDSNGIKCKTRSKVDK